MPRKPRLSYEAQAVFLRQMAFVVKAGIPLAGAYEFLKTEAENDGNEAPLEGGRTDVLAQIFERVRDGVSFSAALRESGCFSEYLACVVELGEKTGNLEQALYDLADYFEQLASIRRKIREAFTYPLILFVMMAAVILFLIIEVLPQFADIISGAGGELPAVAAGILGLGRFISRRWPILLACAAVAAAAMWIFFKSRRGRALVDRLALRRGVFGDAARKLCTARFCTAMKMALGCGNSFADAVGLAAGVVGNREAEKRLLGLRGRVEQGQDVPGAVGDAGIFPRSFVNLFSTAYRTGSLDETLERMAAYYQESFDDAVYGVTSKIEPVLVILLSAVAAVILFSVMLPIINIMQLIG